VEFFVPDDSLPTALTSWSELQAARDTEIVATMPSDASAHADASLSELLFVFSISIFVYIFFFPFSLCTAFVSPKLSNMSSRAVSRSVALAAFLHTPHVAHASSTTSSSAPPPPPPPVSAALSQPLSSAVLPQLIDDKFQQRQLMLRLQQAQQALPQQQQLSLHQQQVMTAQHADAKCSHRMSDDGALVTPPLKFRRCGDANSVASATPPVLPPLSSLFSIDLYANRRPLELVAGATVLPSLKSTAHSFGQPPPPPPPPLPSMRARASSPDIKGEAEVASLLCTLGGGGSDTSQTPPLQNQH
jgi:hypothetical protein